ncbi:hypothetical protein U9M48_042633 [Paspalum notatum var. saurae]|uniref:DUF4218 domain-containing protein n=1 Tax=Paspalum notatum var. saurae TaxID=547442 RepID=A0AAQ3XEP8_PASNO
MEKFLPPRFFNPMQHLFVHLAFEAKVGGPVQFRWMFHIERALKYLRAMVGNNARVEGCIAEAFILKEISYFSSVYFAEEHNVNAPTMRYNVDEEPSASDLPIFQSTGASASASSPYYFKSGERVSAYLYMYANMKEMDPYFKEFQRQNWTSKKQPTSKQLDKMRRDGIDGKPNFPDLFKIYLSEGRVSVRSHGRMSRRFKQVAKGFVEKMIPSKERLFQGSTSTGSRREALLRCVDPNLQGVPIALQRNECEEDEEAGGEDAGDRQEDEEAGDRQEDEEAGDGQEDAQADEELMGGDGSEEVVQRRGTRRSHYVNPPPIPAAADKKLIEPIGDSQWEDVTWDGTGHRRTPNGLLGNLIHVHNPGVVEKNEILLCKSLRVTNSWLKSQGQPVGRFRDALETYRTAEEYGSISHPLFEDQPGPYKALCDLWASEEFQERGPDPSQPELLYTPLATERLAEYGKEMERLHGEGFDWRTAPVGPQAVYESGGGKSHGRYSMFNDMIDSRQVQRRSSSQSLSGSSSRQRCTTSEMEIDSLRQEIQKRDAFLKAQEEYQKEQQAHAQTYY